MDIFGFANHLSGKISQQLAAWENNILNGSYTLMEDYHKAVGIRTACKSIIDSIPAVCEDFVKLQNGPTAPSSTTIPSISPIVEG
jgi:hypothetical protein